MFVFFYLLLLFPCGQLALLVKALCCRAWQSEFGSWNPNGGTDPHKLPLTSTRVSWHTCSPTQMSYAHMPTHPNVLHTHLAPIRLPTHMSYTHMSAHLRVLHTRPAHTCPPTHMFYTHTLIIPFDKTKNKSPSQSHIPRVTSTKGQHWFKNGGHCVPRALPEERADWRGWGSPSRLNYSRSTS